MANKGGEGESETFFDFSGKAEDGNGADTDSEEAEDQSEESEEEPDLFEGDDPESLADEDEESEEVKEDKDEEEEEEDSLDTESEEGESEEEEPDKDEEKDLQKTIRDRLAKQKRKHEGQIDKMRVEIAEAKAEATEFKAKARGLEALDKIVQQTWGDRPDPYGALLAEKGVYDALLLMHKKGDEAVTKILQRAIQVAKGDEKVMKVKEAETPKEDSERVTKLVSRAVRADVDDFVRKAKVLPKYRKALAKETIAQLKGNEDPSRDDIAKAADRALSELSWSTKMVRGVQKKDAEADERPPLGNGNRGASKDSKKKSKEEQGSKKEKEAAPKTMKEFRERSDSILDSLRPGD